MKHATLIDGTDLELWSGRREAQSKLPVLLRRLIRATTPSIQQLSFPADEGVQLPGWDGIVIADEGNEYVPNGCSVWELGTNSNIKAKADGDYEKRKENCGDFKREETTFVFVTSRRWASKQEWVEARRKEGAWLDVRAYDADDLSACVTAGCKIPKAPE